jgi:hypothetical protein
MLAGGDSGCYFASPSDVVQRGEWADIVLVDLGLGQPELTKGGNCNIFEVILDAFS